MTGSRVAETRVVGGDPAPDHDETSEAGWFDVSDLHELDLGSFARHVFVSLGWLHDDDNGDRLG